MNSLSVFQYHDIKTTIQAKTTIGDFSLIWPEPIMKEVALKLDKHDGFLIDNNSYRVSWRDPDYPAREVPSLLGSDRAFVSSIMEILEHLNSTCRERYSNESYYAYWVSTPYLPSAAIQFLNTYYTDSIRRIYEESTKNTSKYFINWSKEFSTDNRFILYLKLVSQYRELFIHFS